ncbi:WecB/TagA/CpsF family glycosyltransferase [Cnuibacter physcomitrellae]|uniref:WecB/TagA/CpsF family glycosyltransferase n=1 Tax=Cnuibacter physcomitrellae TaxID=1619308 RepID=UPI0035713D05
MSHRVGGVRFVAASPEDAALQTVALTAARAPHHVHLANAYSITLASRDERLSYVYSQGICYPDGKPLSWVSRLRRDKPALEQTRGPQFFLDVFRLGQADGVKHFLLGSAPETLEMLEKKLHDRFPDAEIVGAYSPPFRALSSGELAVQDDLIRSSGASIVWVGLGTPKQDIEAQRITHSVGVTAVAVGAAFDYAAGTLREAPPVLRRAGLEWAFRLAMEPRRLWRRYLIGNVQFVVLVARLWRSRT